MLYLCVKRCKIPCKKANKQTGKKAKRERRKKSVPNFCANFRSVFASLLTETANVPATSGGGSYAIDAAAIVMLLVFMLIGARKGAIRSVIGLCSTVLSLAAAYNLAVPAANLLNKLFSVYAKIGETFWYVVGGIIVFILANILLGIVARLLTNIARQVKAVGAANTLLGAMLGFLKAAILICAALAVLSVLPETISFVPKANAAIEKTLILSAVKNNNPLLSWLLKVIERAKDGMKTVASI